MANHWLQIKISSDLSYGRSGTLYIKQKYLVNSAFQIKIFVFRINFAIEFSDCIKEKHSFQKLFWSSSLTDLNGRSSLPPAQHFVALQLVLHLYSSLRMDQISGHPVSGYTVYKITKDEISGIQLDIWPDIRFPAGSKIQYLVLTDTRYPV